VMWQYQSYCAAGSLFRGPGSGSAPAFAAQAQQGAERAPRVGVLVGACTDSDSQTRARISAFREGLAARARVGLTTYRVRFSH
jgi:hypothetical protein